MRWWCFWRLQEKKYWLAEEFFRKSVFFELTNTKSAPSNHVVVSRVFYFSAFGSRFLSRLVDSGFFWLFCFSMVQSKT